jgi:hypothetical protein
MENMSIGQHIKIGGGKKKSIWRKTRIFKETQDTTTKNRFI